MADIVIDKKIVKNIVAYAANCPFCKSDDLYIRSNDAGGGYATYNVCCSKCHVVGPYFGSGNYTKMESIKAWNMAMKKI